MNYKGYGGVMRFDEDEHVFYGQVIGLNMDGITFSGKTEGDAEQDFNAAIDDYLSWAKEEGWKPEVAGE